MDGRLGIYAIALAALVAACQSDEGEPTAFTAESGAPEGAVIATPEVPTVPATERLPGVYVLEDEGVDWRLEITADRYRWLQQGTLVIDTPYEVVGESGTTVTLLWTGDGLNEQHVLVVDEQGLAHAAAPAARYRRTDEVIVAEGSAEGPPESDSAQ